MIETVFLFSLALIWILFAVVQDIKTREIANWLNFSLIAFALGFRVFYSLFEKNPNLFYQGIFGLALFFVLGHLFYRMKVFAGGDAKLFISLGAVLPLNYTLLENIRILGIFVLVFLLVGALYGIAGSIILCMRNFKSFKKEFYKKFKQERKMILFSLVAAILFSFLGFIDKYIVLFSILIFVSPYLYIYAKAVDDACMVKKTKTKYLTEGDWLYHDIRIGKRIIRANWDGLTKGEISLLRKKQGYVMIRKGIPFAPTFLISFLLLVLIVQKKIYFF